MSRTVVVSEAPEILLDVLSAELDTVDATIVETDARDPDEAINACRGAAALIVDDKIEITAEVLDASSLSVIGCSGIGFDNVDVRAAAEHGVTVVNVPAYGLDEVSTHALSLMLACLRRIPAYDSAVRAGEWDWTAGRPIRRLAGSTVGLYSFGKIARSLTAKLWGFDVDVIAHDAYLSEGDMAGFDVDLVPFEDFLAHSDIVSIHSPLTAETRGAFDADAFEMMPSHAILVNTARGGIVDESALYDALVDGGIGAAGLDVFADEPPGDSPLLELDAVIATPHVAFYSEASLEALNRTVAADVARVLQGEPPEHPVDPDTAWV